MLGECHLSLCIDESDLRAAEAWRMRRLREVLSVEGIWRNKALKAVESVVHTARAAQHWGFHIAKKMVGQWRSWIVQKVAENEAGEKALGLWRRRILITVMAAWREVRLIKLKRDSYQFNLESWHAMRSLSEGFRVWRKQRRSQVKLKKRMCRGLDYNNFREALMHFCVWRTHFGLQNQTQVSFLQVLASTEKRHLAASFTSWKDLSQSRRDSSRGIEMVVKRSVSESLRAGYSILKAHRRVTSLAQKIQEARCRLTARTEKEANDVAVREVYIRWSRFIDEMRMEETRLEKASRYWRDMSLSKNWRCLLRETFTAIKIKIAIKAGSEHYLEGVMWF